MNTTELRRMLAEATPGPWVSLAEEFNDYYGVVSVAGSGVVEICREPEHDERIADMALIAATVNALPALLAVVEAAEHWRNAYESNDPSNESFELMCAALDALDKAKL